VSAPITIATITLSDTAHAGRRNDELSPEVWGIVRLHLNAHLVATAHLPREAKRLTRLIEAWAHGEPQPDLLLTIGGTGDEANDITPAAVRKLLDEPMPELIDALRGAELQHTAASYLDRAVVGVVGGSIVVTLSGERGSCNECLFALLGPLRRAIEQRRAAQVGERIDR